VALMDAWNAKASAVATYRSSSSSGGGCVASNAIAIGSTVISLN